MRGSWAGAELRDVLGEELLGRESSTYSSFEVGIAQRACDQSTESAVRESAVEAGEVIRIGSFIACVLWKGVLGFILFFSGMPSAGIVIEGSILSLERGTTSNQAVRCSLPGAEVRESEGKCLGSPTSPSSRLMVFPLISRYFVYHLALSWVLPIFKASFPIFLDSVNLKLLLTNFFWIRLTKFWSSQGIQTEKGDSQCLSFFLGGLGRQDVQLFLRRHNVQALIKSTCIYLQIGNRFSSFLLFISISSLVYE